MSDDEAKCKTIALPDPVVANAKRYLEIIRDASVPIALKALAESRASEALKIVEEIELFARNAGRNLRDAIVKEQKK